MGHPQIGYGKILTKRQAQILALAAEGHSRRKLAELTGIEYVTILGHLNQIYKRLGVSGGYALLHAIQEARRLGLIPQEPGG